MIGRDQMKRAVPIKDDNDRTIGMLHGKCASARKKRERAEEAGDGTVHGQEKAPDAYTAAQQYDQHTDAQAEQERIARGHQERLQKEREREPAAPEDNDPRTQVTVSLDDLTE